LISSNDKPDIIGDEPENEKQYLPFIVNRSFSYFNDSVMLANEMNIHHRLDKKLQFDFYRFALPARKRFSKWVKPEDDEKVNIIAEYYGMNKIHAKRAIKLLDNKAIDYMRLKLRKGGRV
jgi:hypothetical protein